MSDKCVVCNGVGEGKPLYKKLGSSDCSADIFTALHEMQLISLPLQEKDNHYICWDCDESVAEEYLTFVKTETKRKADEVKRRKQDEARNIKLKKKLKLAFKKVHEENLRASGITPPVSKYKMKEKEREENKYHSSHCILCKCSFEDNQGRSYQRFSLLKMVNDEHDVAQVLQKLDVHLNIDLPDEIKRKRFVCCLCYNKMRRDYKSINKNELEKMSKNITENSFIDKINNETQDIFKRRPTAQEHAAEIAKLIPPSLANLYKVVTQDDKDNKNTIKEGRCDDGSSKETKKRKHRQSCSTSDSNSSCDSSSDSSSSTSSSDSSDSENDYPEKSFANNNSSFHTKNMTTTKKYKSGKKDVHLATTKHNNFNNDFNGITASRNLKGTESSEFYEGEAAMEVVQNGVCNLCGLSYSFRPKSFWNSLDSPMPSVTGVTVVDALKILDSKLAAVSANVRKKKFVCKPCYAKVCNGFRSQIIQRIAEKKGIAVGQLEASKLKVKGMDNSLSNQPVRKINGTCENKFENKSTVADTAKKSLSELHHKKNSKNKDKRHHSKKHRGQVVSQVRDSATDCDVKLNSRSHHLKAVFKFTKSRSDHINSPKFAHDMTLLNLINQSQHLQYKGKVVVLYNVCVNVVELKELLPPSAFKNDPVRLELLKNVHLYSNLYRNLKNRTEWSTCILCHKTKLLLKETTHWLEDPVAPPNLMVPLRWAQLSLVSSSSPSAKPNIAVEDGKVCPRCHQNLAVKFGKFVGAKVAVSHGLSSEKIVLDKYKVSFDSNAMNIIADPLERVMAIKETKKHKIGPKSKQRAMEYYIAKPDKSPANSSCIADESVIPISEGEITKVDNSKLVDELVENNDNVSLDLALSESSDSENEAKASDVSVFKQDQGAESINKQSSNEILSSDIPTEKVSISSDISISNELTELTKEENSANSKFAADNVKSSAISSKIESKDTNENITVGLKGGNADGDDNSMKTSTLIPNCESTLDTLNTVNNVHSGETVLMDETAVVKISDHGQSSHNAPSLEKLNQTLLSHINISECSYNPEHMSSVADKTDVCEIFAQSKNNIDSDEMHESKDSNSNEDNGSESCEHTTKQIDLSKIMISITSSNVTHIKNQENNTNIDKSESAKLDSSPNIVVTEDNNNDDYCKLSTMKEKGEVTNQDELKSGISPESSSAVAHNNILNNHLDDVMESDTLITNSNNQSVNLKKSEIEITSVNTYNINIIGEKSLVNFEKEDIMATNSNIEDNIPLSSNSKDIIDGNDAVTNSNCDDRNGNCDQQLIDVNAQTEISQENTSMSVIVSESSTSGLVLNKADEKKKFCRGKNEQELYESDSVVNDTMQMDKEDIKEHCGREAIIDEESQINDESQNVLEGVNYPEIRTDSLTSSDALVNNVSESITNCDIDEEKTADTNTNCDLGIKNHNSGCVAPPMEVNDRQETLVEKETNESINNDKGKYNSLTSPQMETEGKIRETISGSTDIKAVKYTSEMTGDIFAKSIDPNAKAPTNDIRCELAAKEPMHHGSFNDKNSSTIKNGCIHGDDDGISVSQLDTKQINDLVTKNSSIDVEPDKNSLIKSVTEKNSSEQKRKHEKDNLDLKMLPKTKKLMTDSDHIEKELVKINSSLCKGNNGCDNQDCSNVNKFNHSITPVVNMEWKAKENENNLPLVKNTPTIKPTKRVRASKYRKRSTVSNVKTHEKCLSDLIDNEKATSVDVVTDYLNSQREKIIEIIKPIFSEEIHNNAKTCVETVSENLMKIRSKLDNSIHSELPLAISNDKELQNESSQHQIDNHGLGTFSLEYDPLVGDIGENSVAPFAQRKKCRGRPPNTGSDQDSYGSTSNTEKDLNAEEITSSCFLNIWQSIQGVSLDDLLTKDLHQPLRIQQYNVGVVLALNNLRNIIGASLEDLVSWLQKLIPLELLEKGLKPSTEKIYTFMLSLNKSNMPLDPKKLNELLSEDLFVIDKSINNLNQEEVNKNMCVLEDFMEESSNVKDGEIRWDDYLAPVNLDNLLKGKESRVTWEQFNNGLLYALWKVNNLLHGDEGNFVKWLSLTSTTPMKASDYLAMAKAVVAIDKHLASFPEEINKLVAPIVIKADNKIPIKKISSRNKSTMNASPVHDDEVILEKVTVKSGSKNNSYCENTEQKKRPLCDRLNEALNNNIRKHPVTPTNSLRPPSKKMARILPKPSHEAATSSENQPGKGYLQIGLKNRKIEERNKKCVTIVEEDKVQQKQGDSNHIRRLKKNNTYVSVNSSSPSYKRRTRSKNQTPTKSGKSCISNQDCIAGHSSSEDRVPVIPNCTESSNTDSLSVKKRQFNCTDINIENENINAYDQSIPMSNESLQTQIQYALVNQAKISIGDHSANLSHATNTSGVPMIPVMSPSGFLTMIPLSMGITTLPSSPIVGTPIPYNVKSPPIPYNGKSPNIVANLPYAMQDFSALKESPKEKELVCKVSDLEKQLQEIQKQNSQLFELNKKLLQKTTNAEEAPKGLSKTLDSSHYKDALVPSLQTIDDSIQKKRPRGRPRKDAQETSTLNNR